MLVLSRRENESVWIGDDICVEVVEIRHGRVTIGFTCPKTIQIMRTETLLPSDVAKYLKNAKPPEDK